MKRFSLFILLTALFFFAGCGGGSSDYDKYDDYDSDKNDDKTDTVPDKDSSDTAAESTDTDTAEQPDNDGETTDEKDDDSDADNNVQPGNFWETCEGIIACSKGCVEGDSDCVSECYGNGNSEGQLNYRRWRECFDAACAENKTAECSAENCAEWDELCNVSEAFEYKVSFPAPYGSAEFAGSFSFILKNVYPSTENEVTMKAFAKGTVASMQLASGNMITFMRTTKDKRDGSIIEVYQTGINTKSMTPINPVSILRIKIDSAVKGSHNVGVVDESEARFVVADIDDKYNISCYHAFGTGTFSIDEAVIETGAQGKITLSNGNVELFSPQNIPELGGDARETLGVEACSLIQ